MGNIFSAIFGSGKKAEAPKQLPAPALPDPNAAANQAKEDNLARRRTAAASGGDTNVSDFSGVVPTQNLGVKNLLGE